MWGTYDANFDDWVDELSSYGIPELPEPVPIRKREEKQDLIKETVIPVEAKVLGTANEGFDGFDFGESINALDYLSLPQDLKTRDFPATLTRSEINSKR